jgi:hypothetical protein
MKAVDVCSERQLARKLPELQKLLALLAENSSTGQGSLSGAVGFH